jgi:hypothetical protein
VEFLLTTLMVRYMLDTPSPVMPNEGDTVEQIDVKFKWEEDNYTCRGNIGSQLDYVDFKFICFTTRNSTNQLYYSKGYRTT